MNHYMMHNSNLCSIFLRVALTFEKMTMYIFILNLIKVFLIFTVKDWQNALRKMMFNHLISLNVATFIRVFFSSCKQNLTQLFWVQIFS